MGGKIPRKTVVIVKKEEEESRRPSRVLSDRIQRLQRCLLAHRICHHQPSATWLSPRTAQDYCPRCQQSCNWGRPTNNE